MEKNYVIFVKNYKRKEGIVLRKEDKHELYRFK